jgi:hypothetical protein
MRRGVFSLLAICIVVVPALEIGSYVTLRWLAQAGLVWIPASLDGYDA